jgi:hypothetical protein
MVRPKIDIVVQLTLRQDYQPCRFSYYTSKLPEVNKKGPTVGTTPSVEPKSTNVHII